MILKNTQKNNNNVASIIEITNTDRIFFSCECIGLNSAPYSSNSHSWLKADMWPNVGPE